MNTDLDTMRLPELWALYAEATGQATRCPTRSWLIRKITEARAAATNDSPVAAPAAPDGAQGADNSGEAASQADALVAWVEPVELLPSNGVHTADDFGSADDDEAMATSAAPAATPDDDAIPDFDVGTTDLHAQKLSRLSVDELRVLYVDVVGRTSSSFNVAYLVWKIREARKGRVTVGAIQRVPKAEAGAEKEMVVLPLRMPRFEVEELDKVWRQLGFPSRTAFLRRAITEYVGLRAVGG